MPNEHLFAGRYRIEARIGRGTSGDVFRAHDLQLGEDVALKVLGGGHGTDPETVGRFRREVQAGWLAQHPNVVRVLATGAGEGGRLYVSMELLDGRTLSRALTEDGLFPIARACELAAQLADALGSFHEHGMAHRDLKPGNVMLVAGDGGERAKLLDFGLVRFFGAAAERRGVHPLTAAGVVVGTANYLSPEQAGSLEVDHRSDLYSLGVLLYEMLTGRVPFDAPVPTHVLLAHITRAPRPPTELRAELPQSLGGLVLSLLAKKPEERPQRAAEVVHRLRLEARAVDGARADR